MLFAAPACYRVLFASFFCGAGRLFGGFSQTFCRLFAASACVCRLFADFLQRRRVLCAFRGLFAAPACFCVRFACYCACCVQAFYSACFFCRLFARFLQRRHVFARLLQYFWQHRHVFVCFFACLLQRLHVLARFSAAFPCLSMLFAIFLQLWHVVAGCVQTFYFTTISCFACFFASASGPPDIPPGGQKIAFSGTASSDIGGASKIFGAGGTENPAA